MTLTTRTTTTYRPNCKVAAGNARWLAACAAVVIGLTAGSARAVTVTGVTITDTVTGSLTPEAKSIAWTAEENWVKSGGFTYTDVDRGTKGTYATLGNGVDDKVTWSFDFTKDSAWANFPHTGILDLARLTLTLTPKNVLVNTDTVQIVGLPGIATSVIQGLTVNQTQTVSLNLLDSYTSSQILGKLNANSGSLPMAYSDDAIVSLAELELTARPVPEPGSLALLAVGSVGMATWSRFRNRGRSRRSAAAI